jgi:hypothetical protein
MTGIAELKLQRRLLQDQVTIIDERAKRCSEILDIRRQDKLKASLPLKGAISRDRINTFARSAIRELDVSSVKQAHWSVGFETLRQQQLLHDFKLSASIEEKNARRLPAGPGKAGAYKKNPIPETMFPVRHARSELPCAIEHAGSGLQLSWAAPLNVVDYDHYLPVPKSLH